MRFFFIIGAVFILALLANWGSQSAPSFSPKSTGPLAGTYTETGTERFGKFMYMLGIGSASPPIVRMRNMRLVFPRRIDASLVPGGFSGTLSDKTLVLTSNKASPVCGAPYVLTYTLHNEQPPTFRLSNASICPNSTLTAASQGPKTFIRAGP